MGPLNALITRELDKAESTRKDLILASDIPEELLAAVEHHEPVRRSSMWQVASGLAQLRSERGRPPDVYRLACELLTAAGFAADFPAHAALDTLCVAWSPARGLAVPSGPNVTDPPAGFAAEIIRDVAGLCRVKTEFRKYSTWRGVVDAIAEGEAHTSAALLVCHPRRSWVLPYLYPLYTGPRFSVRAIAAVPADLRKGVPGRQLLVNVLDGEVGESLAFEALPWGEHDQTHATLDDALRHMLEDRAEEGKVRCLVADETLIREAMEWYPKRLVDVPLMRPQQPLPLGIAIGPSAAPIRHMLAESIEYLEMTNIVRLRAAECGLAVTGAQGSGSGVMEVSK